MKLLNAPEREGTSWHIACTMTTGGANITATVKEMGKLVEMPKQEQRASPRYPFTAEADVTDLQSNARLSARTSDLARGGCFIDTISTFPIGTRVSLRLTNDRKTFETQARVVYAQQGMGMGLAFATPDPDQLWILEKWLGILSGELPPELHEDEPAGVVERNATPETSANGEAGLVLNELIIALIRKRVLTDSEGKQLLQKLVR